MQIKSFVRYPVDICRARRLLSGRPLLPEPLTERPIVLDLCTSQLLFDCGRHLASLAHHSRSAGSPFIVRCNRLLLSSIARKIHGRDMLVDPATKWIPKTEPIPPNALVLSDVESLDQSQITMLIGRDIDRGIPVMPYPMHPATLPHAELCQLRALRMTKNRAPIFFAGNQKPKYGDDRMRKNFGMLSRLEILDRLAHAFPDRMASSIKEVATPHVTAESSATVGQHSLSHSTTPRPIVIADSRIESIAACDWLAALARAQFFLCCPGSSQPVCHNLVEAMSVGTIPILEYDQRLTPTLRDGENAICFRGSRGLVDAIKRIDRLSSEQVLRLSHNAASHYDQHMCGTKFMRRLRDGDIDVSSGRLCMPFHDRNFYKSIGRTAA